MEEQAVLDVPMTFGMFIRKKAWQRAAWTWLLTGGLSGFCCVWGATYSLRDLGEFVDIGADESRPNAVGPRGRVVGSNALKGYYEAFLFDGTMQGLGTLGGGESFAADINADGVIVGYSHLPSVDLHAFIWTEGGTDGVADNPEMRDLGTFGGNASGAFALNDSGHATGYAQTDKRDHAFIYRDGAMIDIGNTIGSELHSYGFGINESDHVAGAAYSAGGNTSRAFLYDGQSVMFLGDLGGGDSFAYDLNDGDHVAGYSGLADGLRVHAFHYESGSLEDLGTLGGDYSYALAINNANEIVGGSFVDAQNAEYHAFFWRDGVMEDLNSMLDASGEGWLLIEARAINDRGQIAGVGWAHGGQRGFLLTPDLQLTDPRITGITVGDNDVRISVSTLQGQTYALEATTQSSLGGWSVVVGNVAGTGGDVDITDPAGVGKARRFYRVSATKP